MGKYCSICGCNLNDPVNESSPEADLCSVCGGPRIKRKLELRVVDTVKESGYICWHPDSSTREAMNGYSAQDEFNILQVFPTFESALEELLEWDEIPQKLNRREKINFVDDRGWRIKKVTISFTNKDTDREIQIAAWLKACLDGKIDAEAFVHQAEKLFS